MNIQEYRIVCDNGDETFFFKYNFKTAYQHAKAYIDRNKSKIGMKLYIQSTKPRPFPRWELIETSEVADECIL